VSVQGLGCARVSWNLFLEQWSNFGWITLAHTGIKPRKPGPRESPPRNHSATKSLLTSLLEAARQFHFSILPQIKLHFKTHISQNLLHEQCHSQQTVNFYFPSLFKSKFVAVDKL